MLFLRAGFQVYKVLPYTMKRIFYFLVLIAFACNNGPFQPEGTADRQLCDASSLDSILIFRADTAARARYSLDILNEDGSLYGQIVSDQQQEPYLSTLKGKIRAYYPDYYIIHFDAARKSSAAFCIKVGSEVKIVKANQFLTFLSWPDYIVSFFCATDKSNPLRVLPNDTAQLVRIEDYDELSFRCLEVKGEWVKVTCFADCEGCPENNTSISGWIRWKREGAIILKQYYAC